MSATDAEIKLCEQKHKEVDRRLESLEGKMWVMIGAAFLQMLAVIGYFFATFVVKG
jgi:hypothetical protein